MLNLKPGDIVKIIDHSGSHWNSKGFMNHWMGKIVTIKTVYNKRRIKIVDDIKEHGGGGWTWYYTDFVPASNVEISEYLRKRNTLL